MATCRECKQTPQHALSCSRRRYSGSWVQTTDSDSWNPGDSFDITSDTDTSSSGGE